MSLNILVFIILEIETDNFFNLSKITINKILHNNMTVKNFKTMYFPKQKIKENDIAYSFASLFNV